jgi:hypothetical protein
MTINLQLDTGAGDILINRKAAEKLRLEVISSYHVRGIGDSGARESFVAQAQSIRIGPLDFRDRFINIEYPK